MLRAQVGYTSGLKSGSTAAAGTEKIPVRIPTRNLRKVLREIAKKAGHQRSFHESQHTFATIPASEVSRASLSRILGHRRMATTSDLYAHLHDPDAVIR